MPKIMQNNRKIEFLMCLVFLFSLKILITLSINNKKEKKLVNIDEKNKIFKISS